MIRNLIRRLWPMSHDAFSPARLGRHRGKPALVAGRRVEHQGATADSPLLAELPLRDPEPEETETEAAQREADELARHREQLEEDISREVHAEFSARWSEVEYLATVVDEACRVVFDELGLNKGEADRLMAAYRSAAEPTGGWPTVQFAAVTV